VNGRQHIIAFLTHKWGGEFDYRLIRELGIDPLVRRAVAFLLAPPGVALLRASAYDLALASGVSRGTP